MVRHFCHTFAQKGYKNLTEDNLDRKMRNMKKTYRTIKDNNKKTSTGKQRINWEYFDTFEEIFVDDCTMNIGPTLSSLPQENELQQDFHRNENTNTSSLLGNSEHTYSHILFTYSLSSLAPSINTYIFNTL